MISMRMSQNNCIDAGNSFGFQKGHDESSACISVEHLWTAIDQHIFPVGKFEERRVSLSNIQERNTELARACNVAKNPDIHDNIKTKKNNKDEPLHGKPPNIQQCHQSNIKRKS